MLQLLGQDGFRLVPVPRQAGILVVNTCGFIDSARQESLAVLRSLAQDKRPDQILIAAGCLSQRFGEQVASQVPGVDGILGTRRWMDIVAMVRDLRRGMPGGHRPQPLYHLPNAPTMGVDEKGTLRASISGASAYLKIADGCRRPCAFCAIPLIKGTTVSRPMDRILEEASLLQQSGVRELVLIAQDTTDYGFDLGMKDGLTRLLEGILTAAPGIPWIRILYAFPGYVTDRLIELMAGNKQILPYLDIPLQHASRDVLTAMRRPSDLEWVHRTVDKMRAAVPGLAIRTTFIVGYPNETEKDFQILLDFVSRMRFDRLGTFKFSFETGTGSESLGDPLPPEVKEERYQRLMELQQAISLQINQAFIGRKLDVLIEGRQENGIAVGRSYRDAPEIDGVVLVEGQAEVGGIVPVLINGAMEYDLSGTVTG
jgi:ribosomal protein S12 methylthiotransferase